MSAINHRDQLPCPIKLNKIWTTLTQTHSCGAIEPFNRDLSFPQCCNNRRDKFSTPTSIYDLDIMGSVQLNMKIWKMKLIQHLYVINCIINHYDNAYISNVQDIKYSLDNGITLILAQSINIAYDLKGGRVYKWLKELRLRQCRDVISQYWTWMLHQIIFTVICSYGRNKTLLVIWKTYNSCT